MKPAETVPIKEILLFNLLLISFLILTSRLATFLHEVFGHALVAVLSGGTVSAITVSLFGGGYTTAGTGSHHIVVSFIFSLSGILLNLLTGFYAISMGKKMAFRNISAGLFLSVFSMASLAGAMAYLVLGLYYDFGDPVAWIQNGYEWFNRLWVLFLTVSPAVSFAAAKLYIFIQQQVFPADSFFGRLKITIMTLGFSSIVYGMLFLSTSQSLVSLDASTYAFKRAEAEIIEKKKAELSQRLLKENPKLTDEQLRSILDKTPVIVEPDEVPAKFPLLPVLGIFLAIGGIFGIGGQKIIIPDIIAPLNEKFIFLFAILSVLVIAVLASTGGVIYKG